MRKDDRRYDYLNVIRSGLLYLFSSYGINSNSLNGSGFRSKNVSDIINKSYIDYNCQDSNILLIREQVIIAALDAGEYSIAEKLIDSLKKQFPESSRIGRLEGLLYEAQMNFDKAQKIYSDMLERNPANFIATKRKIAILIESGKDLEAINELNAFIRSNMGDDEAWRALASIYTSLGKFDMAAFCYEEIVLTQPHNYASHLIYSEYLLSSGKSEQYIIARKHLSQSLVNKRENNARTAFGLMLSCIMIQEETKNLQQQQQQKQSKKKTTELNQNDDVDNSDVIEAKQLNKDVALFAADKIIETYKNGKAPNQIQDLIKRVVENLKESFKDE